LQTGFHSSSHSNSEKINDFPIDDFPQKWVGSSSAHSAMWAAHFRAKLVPKAAIHAVLR
jgi:hypothetical protein